MKNGKKYLSVFLVLALAASMAACGEEPAKSGPSSGENSGSTESGVPSSSENDEPVPVSILLSGDNTPNASNIVLDTLGEKTNTIIEMTYVPSADIATKRSTMAASDTLPDLFSVSGTEAQEYIDAGLLYDLTGLESKAPNWFDNAADLIPQMPLNKEGLYVIPTGAQGWADNLNIRTDWLENLGMEMPTNLDELYKVFEAFTNGDPDGNGQDDTFALCANSSRRPFSMVFGAYGIAYDSDIVLENGTVSSWVKHPRFLEAITYIRSLINAGFVEPDWLTIPQMDMFGKLWNGVAGAMVWECVGPTNNWYPSRYTEETPPTFGFAVIEGPYGNKSVKPTFPSLNSGYAVASRTENIDAVLRVADYCCTDEGNTLLYLGIEDVMFKWTDKENGKYELLGEYSDSAVQRANGGFCYHDLCRPAINCEFQILNSQTREGVELAWDSMMTEGVVYCYDNLKTRADYGTDMDQIINEMYVALLQAGSDDELQGIYDEYMNRWETEAHGLEWEAEITEWYNNLK